LKSEEGSVFKDWIENIGLFEREIVSAEVHQQAAGAVVRMLSADNH
jgi:hypothetical protein